MHYLKLRNIAAIALFFIGSLARAASFTATVDQAQIGEDESVSVKFAVSVDGNATVGGLKFSAPDFEVINEYNSNFMQSYYENGQFGMRKTQTLTKVLRPMKKGTLKVSGIQIDINGKTERAADLLVTVTTGGAGTPPPNRYGGTGGGLRGSGKIGNRAQFLVRAEVNKAKVYKGEQVVVSYYLYRRVKIFNIAHDKIPVLDGFLREDIETPLFTGNSLNSEIVVLDGTQYMRSLLARYAAYPLREGKLNIDSMGLKFSYIPDRTGAGDFDEEDVFAGVLGFMNPRSAQEKSPQITIDVMPLPTDGKPASFTGGVGDFSITAVIDRTEAKVNDAVTLTVKVEGSGNLAAIGEPKASWPQGLELYDTKGKSGPKNSGVKIFEYVLIPRAPGKYTLPALELSFFDPNHHQYQTRSTSPLFFEVSGEAVSPAPNQGVQGSAATDTSSKLNPFAIKEDPFGLKTKSDALVVDLHGQPFWRWLYWIFLGCLGIFLLMVGFFSLRRLRRIGWRKSESVAPTKSLRELKDRIQKIKAEEKGSTSDSNKIKEDLVSAYEFVCGLIYDDLDEKFHVTSRALPRRDLVAEVVGAGKLSSEQWKVREQILEYAEKVRFAMGSGAVTAAEATRELEAIYSKLLASV